MTFKFVSSICMTCETCFASVTVACKRRLTRLVKFGGKIDGVQQGAEASPRGFQETRYKKGRPVITSNYQ